MKLAGDTVQPQSPSQSSDDMLMNENESLSERVAELEKKVQDQEDELVCLKGTLADVVRRLTQLETTRVPHFVNHNNHQPIKEALSSANRRAIPPSGLPTLARGNGSLVYRRSSHHQSTNSLHSDGQSSSSASPVPSPCPFPPQQSSVRSSPSPKHTPAPSRANTQLSMKKWSSALDFSSGHSSPTQGSIQRRLISGLTGGSMFNLHASKPNHTDGFRHGVKDAIFNSDGGFVKMYLRGRPITMYGPDPLLEDYSLTKVDGLPSERLKLDWVYGYRGRDCRSNLHYLPTGEMVYFVAAVVVLYNVEELSQRHYLGHTDDVKCLAVHPNKLLIASGQVAGHDKREGRPHVNIWDSVSLNTLHILGLAGDFDRSIACLAFSKLDGGALLCVVDEGHDHSISVWDWQKGERGLKLVETKSSADPVLAVEFHPMDKTCFISCGKGHVNFWSLEGTTLLKSSGVFEKNKPKYIHCLAFSELGDLITGDSNGNILIWDRGSNRVSRIVNGAHDGGIFSICAMKDGNFATGGGKDRYIREWSGRFQATGNFVVIAEGLGPVRMLAPGRGNYLLVGTTKNCILQGTIMLGFQTVVQGHTEELWGLAVHPNQNQFVTCGQDGCVHLWDTLSHSVVWSLDIQDRVQSGCFSPDGSTLIVATVSGRWFGLDSETKTIFIEGAVGNESIDVVKFSPSGQYLALGSHDNNIYVYQVEDSFHKYSRIGRCGGHSSFVTHLDWSAEGPLLRSNSGDLELLFWNASICRQITLPSDLRNVDWDTETCPIGFSVLGIWPEGADGSDVNCCTRSHSRKLLVTGDDWGKIKLFSYPACHLKALCHIYGGHSSHVTSVGFLADDSRLISLGGKDCSILQWMIV